MLLVIRPAQSAGQFEIVEDIVIDLAESGIGIEHIWILTEEIIVPLIVQIIDGTGVGPAASKSRAPGPAGLNECPCHQTLHRAGIRRIPIRCRSSISLALYIVSVLKKTK